MFFWLFLGMFGAYLGILSLAPSTPSGFFWGISSVLMPAIEITAVVCTGWLLLIILRRFNPWLAAAAAVLPIALLTSAYFSQLASLYISGSYLTAFALQNIGETRFIASPTIFAVIAIIALFFIGLTVYLARGFSVSGPQRTLVQIAALVPLWALPVFHVDASSETSKFVDLQPDLSPASSLFRAYRTARINIIEAETLAAIEERARSGEYSGIAAFDPDHSQPFRRISDFAQPLPFPGEVPHDVQPNIIIVFTEGFSARLMESYGGRIPGVTPHLDAYARRFMLVDDYYGHSAATYRGIIGQLSSGFLVNGGANWASGFGEGDAQANTFGRTLPEILSERGYDTVFLTPDNPDDPWVRTVRTIGFDQVYHLENIAELLGQEPQEEPQVTRVPDRDLFTALWAFLSDRDRSSPALVGVYNLGTHAFLDTREGQARFGSGDNPLLNRIYEYDTAIAPFLESFFASPFSEDTILIITADHATYHEPPAIEAFEADDYAPYFIDRIPLMIHSPYHDLPDRFDADIRTSVDFAPSLLHLLGYIDVENAFLGASIFDKGWSPGIQMAATGNTFYALGGPRFVETIENVELTDDQRKMEEVIRFYYHVQNHGATFRR